MRCTDWHGFQLPSQCLPAEFMAPERCNMKDVEIADPWRSGKVGFSADALPARMAP